MAYCARFNPGISVPGNGSTGFPIFTNENTCLKGFTAGIGIFFFEDYPSDGLHDDHEGFYVVSGSGYAKVGDQEFEISEGTSFVAPAGVPHAIKKKKGGADMKIYWFHFPV
mgnify:CR=1 FL=1